MSLISRRTAQLAIGVHSTASTSLQEDSFFGVLQGLLNQCAERPRNIVQARFGLGSEAPKTLDAIGKKYGITRERVRQIVRSVARDIGNRKKNEELKLKEVCDRIVSTIESKSGILTQEALYAILAQGDNHEVGAIRFFVENFVEVTPLKETAQREQCLSTQGFQPKQWDELIRTVDAIFNEHPSTLSEKQLFASVVKRLPAFEIARVFDYLRVSRMFKQNVFGVWGRAEWEDVTPKGTRDKIYLILKSFKKPLHFREITDLIDENGLQKNNRKTHYQTVHNELIKDKRFVLVGRGIYALEEWGYEQGTIRDIITKILREAKRSLTRDEIFEKISVLREAKRSTVVINLNTHFQKVGKDAYMVRENK
ncbi:MAG: HTH domain-containing protein [Candidatus Moraniibacteriota bacterium]